MTSLTRTVDREGTHARIVHEAESSRYTLWLGDETVGLVDYAVRGGDIVFTNTEIDPARHGEGLDTLLLEAALDDAQARFAGRIVPSCPLVVDFIATHPEYSELLAS